MDLAERAERMGSALFLSHRSMQMPSLLLAKIGIAMSS